MVRTALSLFIVSIVAFTAAHAHAFVDPCQTGMYNGPECEGSEAYVPPDPTTPPPGDSSPPSGGRRFPRVPDTQPATTTQAAPQTVFPEIQPATTFIPKVYAEPLTQKLQQTNYHGAAPLPASGPTEGTLLLSIFIALAGTVALTRRYPLSHHAA